MNPVATRLASRVSFERTLASAKRTMLLSEIVRLAVDSFRASKVRFMLTALGMVIGSASLILVVTIGLTGKQYILNLLQSIGTNMVYIEYSGGGTGSINNFQNDRLTREDERAVDEQVPSVMYSSPMLEMHDRISINGVEKQLLVLGVSPQYKQVRNLKVISGRFFDDQDESLTRKWRSLPDICAGNVRQPGCCDQQEFQPQRHPLHHHRTFKESVDTFGQSEIADQTILILSVARISPAQTT